jgi:uncharacterized MAPEG superfamily protein
MNVELKLLLWSGALTLGLAVVSVVGALLQVGLPKLAGNREDMPEIEGWGGRAERAHHNMLESLALFAILVLTAKVVGVSNATTILGAQIFFWARVAHAVIYIIGIPWIRTAAWAISVIGLVLIFLQLIQL